MCLWYFHFIVVPLTVDTTTERDKLKCPLASDCKSLQKADKISEKPRISWVLFLSFTYLQIQLLFKNILVSFFHQHLRRNLTQR